MASLVRCLSAISLSFIILVTPWSILQVITSVTMEQVSITLILARTVFSPLIFTFSCSHHLLWTSQPTSCSLASALSVQSSSGFSIQKSGEQLTWLCIKWLVFFNSDATIVSQHNFYTGLLLVCHCLLLFWSGISLSSRLVMLFIKNVLISFFD